MTNPNDNCVVNGQLIAIVNWQLIAIVDDFNDLGSYISSTNKDIKEIIRLTWSTFAKLKPILTSLKPTVKFKIYLFKAACASIPLYGCEECTLTQGLTAKLGKFSRKCYRIMLGICRAETCITNTHLYRLTDEHPVFSRFVSASSSSPDIVFECRRMNIYVIYQSKIRLFNLCGN